MSSSIWKIIRKQNIIIFFITSQTYLWWRLNFGTTKRFTCEWNMLFCIWWKKNFVCKIADSKKAYNKGYLYTKIVTEPWLDWIWYWKLLYIKLSCDSRFQRAFTACVCVFKVLKTTVATRLNKQKFWKWTWKVRANSKKPISTFFHFLSDFFSTTSVGIDTFLFWEGTQLSNGEMSTPTMS